MMQSETLPLAFVNDNKMNASGNVQSSEKDSASAADPTVWVDRHGNSLFRYAMMCLHDETLAEDLVQETLLAAIQSLDKFSDGASEKTWLISILKHKVIDYFRKNSKQIQLTDEDTDLSDFDHFFKREDEWDGHWRINLRPVEISETPDYAFPILLNEYRREAELPEYIVYYDLQTARQLIEKQLYERKIVATHYRHVDGASFAAPIAASVVAQMLEANPHLTPLAVKNILISTASKLSQQPSIRQGYGV